jgi:flagellar biosynthesis protein FlhF
MQIKRFEAKNMTEALRQIKRELGAEAVILSAKDIRKENRLLGISRQIGVEVTAAVDGVMPAQGVPPAARPRAERHADLEKQTPARRPAVSSPPQEKIRDIVRIGLKQAPPERITTSLRKEAVEAHEPSRPAIRDAKKNVEADLDAQMRKRLKANGLEVMPWPFNAEKSHTIALVGNAGVGKTTTIAKLAARLQHEEDRQVGLISLDREKIGGGEQLRIYAEILQIPLEIPKNAADLPKALKNMAGCDVILVDTPAIGASKARRPEVFETHLPHIDDLTVWLVVGADNQVDNMQLSAAVGDDLDLAAVIVTKADLNPRLGGVMQFLGAVALPVVGLCNGPDVPQDLTEASLHLFARCLMQAPTEKENPAALRTSPSVTDAEGQYLANRNSDIFHRTGCKWIRLINKENIVMFRSFADALNHRFKPCRYCNPQHMSITGMIHHERAVE